MPFVDDLTGQTFGKWTVLGRAPTVERAEWWHLTGWQLGPRNERQELRGPLMVWAEGVVIYAPRS